MSVPTPKVRIYETYRPCPPERPEARRYLVVRDSLNITFYMRRPHSEVRHAVAHALEVYLQAVGQQKLTCYATRSGDWQDLDDAGWAFIREYLLQPEGANILLREHATVVPGHAFVHLGVGADTPSDGLFPDEASAVSFWLPTEYLEERGPGWLRELALELGARLPFNSGHAGLFLQSSFDPMTHAEVRAACLAYPGLDLLNVDEVASNIGTRVKGAHWLTFLGQPVLGELGGATGLRSRLHSPDTTLQDLGADRVVVTLGQWPEAGDQEPERTLAPHRELARVLEPWLYRERTPWTGFTEDDMRRWERRLLD
ncbi:type VI immunity family protein [Pyxidicoccus trucidator]|uniref:type VI immunity family protein n=1 Tax=Pyxidicoccus trucidator TaxID=2709662 RepID=UPI0013D95011|nr:type VI immunity family protein [Pyxidicoccus trucidator]